MSYLSLALVALLTQAPDAPLLKDAPPPDAIEVKAGDVVQNDGVCMGSAKSIQVGKRIASCEASLAVAETKTMISTPVLVGGIVAIFVISVGLGAAAAYAVKR